MNDFGKSFVIYERLKTQYIVNTNTSEKTKKTELNLAKDESVLDLKRISTNIVQPTEPEERVAIVKRSSCCNIF